MRVLFIVGKDRSPARAFAVELMEHEHEVKGFTEWDLDRHQYQHESVVVHFGVMFDALLKFKPDLVVNAYEMVAREDAQALPHQALHVNAVAAGFVALACRLLGVKLLHLSSPEVFPGGRSQPGPYDTLAETYPINTYGFSKLLGERAVETYAKDKSTIVRLGYLYGMDIECPPHSAAVNSGQVTTYVDNFTKVTPTYLGFAVARLVAFVEMWDEFGGSGGGIAHLGPNEPSVTWYEFLASRFALDEPGKPGIAPLTQEKHRRETFRKAERPQFGGLHPSPYLTTADYDRSLEAFQAEWMNGRNAED